jgi:hypothetical protein
MMQGMRYRVALSNQARSTESARCTMACYAERLCIRAGYKPWDIECLMECKQQDIQSGKMQIPGYKQSGCQCVNSRTRVHMQSGAVHIPGCKQSGWQYVNRVQIVIHRVTGTCMQKSRSCEI